MLCSNYCIFEFSTKISRCIENINYKNALDNSEPWISECWISETLLYINLPCLVSPYTSQPLRLPATDEGETSGENTSGTWPYGPENTQQPKGKVLLASTALVPAELRYGTLAGSSPACPRGLDSRAAEVAPACLRATMELHAHKSRWAGRRRTTCSPPPPLPPPPEAGKEGAFPVWLPLAATFLPGPPPGGRRAGGQADGQAGETTMMMGVTGPPVARGKAAVPPGALCLGAGLCGALSFALLAASLGTDYWYLLRVDREGGNRSAGEAERLGSHSGLWRLCEGMHRAFVVLLPLSLILIVFGWICGIMGSLARSACFLQFTGCYFLLGALLTLSGTSIYICYSGAAFTETVRMFDQERFKHVHIAFGWSLALAWLSFGTEGLAGVLFLLAARQLQLKPNACSVSI
ncbi:transmembrane protein 235 isoform X2 [Anolis carolinensis]|uniref:transmembrane protein 235 isoform X2 n=1 Tax=Anolis carolinensis TaxID=28377 RepID=UPI002F2B7B84